MSFTIFWQFEVKPDHVDQFEAVYGPHGAWAALFECADGYLGTELHREIDVPRRYVVIDRWRSVADHEAFRAAWRAEYEALDRRCESLTEREVPLGRCEQLAR